MLKAKTKKDKVNLLGGACFIAAPQVVDVDDEAGFVLADHVADFTLIDPLILL